jgi:hypothetical protein
VHFLVCLVSRDASSDNVIWHSFLQKDIIQMLEKVQHRATRMVSGLAKQHYEDELKLMNFPSLAYGRLNGDVIGVFKYMQAIYNVDCTQTLDLLIYI